MRIVTVYLKGPWSQKGTDWDRGVVRRQEQHQITLADNDYGLNSRTYPMTNVTRIDETGHW